MVSFNKLLALSVASYVGTTSAVPFVAPINTFFNKAFGLEIPRVADTIDVFLVGSTGLDDRPVPGDSPIVQCEVHAKQILALNLVTITPNPPQKGANLTFIAEGFVLQDIEDGAYVEVDVRYGYIRLIHQTFDLCEEIQKVDMECPIKKGKQTIIKEVEIPNEVPPGKYIINAKAFTKDDVFITCLNAVVDFPAS